MTNTGVRVSRPQTDDAPGAEGQATWEPRISAAPPLPGRRRSQASPALFLSQSRPFHFRLPPRWCGPCELMRLLPLSRSGQRARPWAVVVGTVCAACGGGGGRRRGVPGALGT